MAKLPRIFQVLFGQNCNQSHSEQFGSRAVYGPGGGVPSLDPTVIQALAPFINNGWYDAVNGPNSAPFLEDMNGLFILAFRQLCYLFQAGIAEWDSSTVYFTGSIVTAPGTTQMYGSLTDNNQGNVLPNQSANAFWTYLNPQSVQPGIISAFAGAVAPFGYLLCDGTAYAQGSYASLYAAISGAGWDTFNGAAAPGVGQFRVPDLRSLTLMGVGHGSGFSARALAQLVGEETHILGIGEMPVHTHAERALNQGGGQINIAVGSGATPQFDSGINTDAAGGDGAHNNMQPSAGVNWIIKT